MKFEDMALILAVVSMFVVAGLGAVALKNEAVHHERFMKECRADGNKQYKCDSMWRSGRRR